MTGPSPATRAHVLLVEDSSLVTGALRLLLEEHGYEVSVADSLETARAQVRDAAPDVVLLDVALPDGDGLDLAREWSADGPAVLALTGFADEETHARCVAAGCQTVLTKPIAAADLLENLAKITAPG